MARRHLDMLLNSSCGLLHDKGIGSSNGGSSNGSNVDDSGICSFDACRCDALVAETPSRSKAAHLPPLNDMPLSWTACPDVDHDDTDDIVQRPRRDSSYGTLSDLSVFTALVEGIDAHSARHSDRRCSSSTNSNNSSQHSRGDQPDHYDQRQAGRRRHAEHSPCDGADDDDDDDDHGMWTGSESDASSPQRQLPDGDDTVADADTVAATVAATAAGNMPDVVGLNDGCPCAGTPSSSVTPTPANSIFATTPSTPAPAAAAAASADNAQQHLVAAIDTFADTHGSTRAPAAWQRPRASSFQSAVSEVPTHLREGAAWHAAAAMAPTAEIVAATAVSESAAAAAIPQTEPMPACCCYVQNGADLLCEPSRPRSDLPQDLLQLYTVGVVIGEGSFGTVHLGRHKLTGEHVAIKICDKQALLGTGEVDSARQEMTLLRSSLLHPHIVRGLDMFEDRHFFVSVLEFCEKGELFDRIVLTRHLEEAKAATIIAQLLSAVNHCHRHGVAHRDIKPENVLLDEQDNVKLIDFGLCGCFPVAANADPSRCSVASRPGSSALFKTMCGSTMYMAPEVIGSVQDDPDYDGTLADAWSIGVVAYATLFGTVPFCADDPRELLQLIDQRDVRIPADCSELASDFLKGLLCFNPARRMPVKNALLHPWITHFVTPEALDALLQPVPEPLDESVLDMLAKHYTIPDPARQLNNPNLPLWADYSLIVKAIARGRKVTLAANRGVFSRRIAATLSPRQRRRNCSEPPPLQTPVTQLSRFRRPRTSSLSRADVMIAPSQAIAGSSHGAGESIQDDADVFWSHPTPRTSHGRSTSPLRMVTASSRTTSPPTSPPSSPASKTPRRRKALSTGSVAQLPSQKEQHGWRAHAMQALRWLGHGPHQSHPRKAHPTDNACFCSAETGRSLKQRLQTAIATLPTASVVQVPFRGFQLKVVCQSPKSARRQQPVRFLCEVVQLDADRPTAADLNREPNCGVIIKRLSGSVWAYQKARAAIQESLLTSSAPGTPRAEATTMPEQP